MPPTRRSAGAVEPARLESVYIRKGIKGSNPFSSANKTEKPLEGHFCFRAAAKLACADAKK